MKSLIAKGTSVNDAGADTPLLEAIHVLPKSFNIEVVKVLLDAKGIDVNKYGTRAMGAYSWVRTPLIMAAYTGNTELVKLLLDKGAKPDLPDWYIPDQTNFGKGPLNNALLYAATNGYPEIATFLLDKGAKIDYQNASGSTPLISASSHGGEKADKQADIAKAIAVLLDRGAKYDMLAIPTNPKYLKIDLPPGTPAAVSSLMPINGSGVSALHMAANTGFMEAATLLLDKGAKIELPSYGNKWTALFFATQTKQNAMITYLLDRGANIEAADTVGTTCLQLTAPLRYNATDVVR